MDVNSKMDILFLGHSSDKDLVGSGNTNVIAGLWPADKEAYQWIRYYDVNDVFNGDMQIHFHPNPLYVAMFWS